MNHHIGLYQTILRSIWSKQRSSLAASPRFSSSFTSTCSVWSEKDCFRARRRSRKKKQKEFDWSRKITLLRVELQAVASSGWTLAGKDPSLAQISKRTKIKFRANAARQSQAWSRKVIARIILRANCRTWFNSTKKKVKNICNAKVQSRLRSG